MTTESAPTTRATAGQPVTGRGPSTVKSAMTVRRTQALFDAMAGDQLFREQFVTDPAQIYTEYVHGTSLDRHRADVINQFIYAVLANDDLLQWLIDYRTECQGTPPSDDELAKSFTRAVVDHNAHHAAFALTRSATENQALFPFDPAVKDVVFGSHGGHGSFQTFLITQDLANTEVSTYAGTDPHTEMSTITEMSGPRPPEPPLPPIPIHTTITNVGPIIPGDLTGLGGGTTQLVIDAIRGYAAALRDGGALDDVGLS